MITKINNLA